jgi:hypothetical protein
MRNNIAQGALEYLLLLVAAMFVVAIVFVFINSTIEPTKDSGSEQTYSFLCDQLDSNTADCACYNNNSKGYFPRPDGVTVVAYCCSSNRDSFLKERFEELAGICP